jgi:hypothetical protein
MLLACSSAARSTELTEWPELSFFIDGIIEIWLKVPPEKFGKESPEMQFIGIKDDSPTRLFLASYDPGKGRNSDLLLTLIGGVIIRVEGENSDGVDLSLEDIKNEIYLSRPDVNQYFEFVGKQNFAGRSWLKINLIGGQRQGVSYSAPIQDNYVLVLSMSMYGKESNKTRLFKDRLKTMIEIVKSVRISSISD